MGSSTSESHFGAAPYIQPDAIFELTKRFEEDDSPQKVNLGQGTYRDENGDPWVLPSVRAAKEALGSVGHEYLPIRGLQKFCDRASQLVLHDTSALRENRVATCQALSGTGALLLAGKVMKTAQTGIETVYIPSPSWSNHEVIFLGLGFKVEKLPYYNNETFDFEQYLNALKVADRHSAVILHACAHNPTGCDPSRQQWQQIADVFQERVLFPIFDAAYLGFNSGSVDEDAWAIRHFTEDKAMEVAICISFAKNMGLYGERVGLVAFVTKTSEISRHVSSVLEREQRATVSSPPAYGARIAATVLGDPKIAAQWSNDLITMSSRIRGMRKSLYDKLLYLSALGNWTCLIEQGGMFAYTGLNKKHIHLLQETFHIYMPETGRMSIPGLNEGNVGYVAHALDSVVRTVS